MKKIKLLFVLFPTVLMLFFLTDKVVKIINAQSADSDLLTLAEQGPSRSCLSASLHDNHQVSLRGQCAGNEGYLLVCQDGNKENIEKYEKKVEKCEEHPEKCNDLVLNIITTEIAQGVVGPGCTTGIPSVDKQFLGADNTGSRRSCKPPQHFTSPNVSVTVDCSDTLASVGYQFYCISPPGARTLGQGGSQGVEGEERTQQLGQVTQFDFGNTENSDEDCVGLAWDPFGRTFDSQSLEPIEDVVVTLLNSTKKPADQEFNLNYDITGRNGLYNIQVEKEGYYYLSVEPPATHVFTSAPNLNPNYSKMYSNIYYPDVSFEEKVGDITIHDVPLKPIGEPYHSEPVVYEDTVTQIDLGNFIKIGGKVSHPLANVCLKGLTSGKDYGCQQADRAGTFKISLSKEDYPQEAMIVNVYKVDPNNLSQFLSQSVGIGSLTPIPVDKKASKVVIQPLLRYIDGYIYDETGQVLPQATVIFRLKGDSTVIYTTRTSDKGWLTVMPKDLPFLDYYLEITPNSSTKKIVQATSDFVKNNDHYLSSENIDLISATKDSLPVVRPSADSSSVNTKTPLVISPPEKKKIISPYILIFILILLITALVVMILYFKKKSLTKEN